MTLKHISVASLTRTVFTLLTFLLLAVSTGIIIVAVAFSTTEGQKWIEKTVTFLLSSDHQKVRFAGFHFDPSGELHIDKVTLEDKTAPWLRLQDITLNWRWSDLLLRKAHLENCRVRKIVLLHEPARPPKPTLPFSGTQNPFYVSLHQLQTFDRFEIKTLVIRKGFSGLTRDFSYGITGKLRQRQKLVGAVKIQDLMTPANHFNGSLVFDRPNQKLSIELDAHEDPLGLLSQYFNLENKVPITFTVSGTGPLTKWPSTYALNLGDRGSFKGTFNLKLKGGFWHYTTKGDLEFDDQVFPDLARLLGEQTDFSSKGQLSRHLLNIETLKIKNNRFNLTGYMNADFTKSQVLGEISTHVPELDKLNFVSKDVSGEGTMLVNLKGPLKALESQLDLSLSKLTINGQRIDQTLVTIESVFQSRDRDVPILFDLKAEGFNDRTEKDGGFFSEPITLKGSAVFLPSKKDLTILSIDGHAHGATLTGTGHLKAKTHDLTLDLSMPNLDEVFAVTKTSPDAPTLGSAAYTLTLKGPYTKPSLSLEGSLRDIHFEKKFIGHFEQTLNLEDLYTLPHGTFKLQEVEADNPLSLTSTLSSTEKSIKISSLSLQGGDDPFAEGDLLMNKRTSLIEGQIVANKRNLSLLTPYLPLNTLSGSIDLNVAFKEGPEKKQRITSTLNLSNLDSPALATNETNLAFDFDDYKTLKSTLSMKGNRFASKFIETIKTTVEGDITNLDLFTIIEDPSLTLKLEGSLHQEDDKTRVVTFKPTDGTLHDHPLHIGKIEIMSQDHGLTLAPLDVQYDKGTAHFHYTQSKDTLDGGAMLKNFPMGFFNLLDSRLLLGGDGEGQVSISGPGRLTTAKANLTIKGLKSHNPIHGDVPAVNASLTTDLHAGKLSGRFETLTKNDGTEKSPDSQFSTSFDFETEDCADSFFPIIDHQSAFKLSLLGNLNLASFSAFFPEEEDIIKGTLKSKLSVTGTTAQPILSGTLSLAEGYYESDESGILFKNIKAVAESRGNTLSITNIQSEDNLTGKVTGQGKVIFKSLFEPNYTINLDFKNMRTINQEDLKITATGKLSVQGNESTAKISGSAEVDKAIIDLAQTSSPDIVKIKVQERVTSGKVPRRTKQDPTTSKGPGYLDIAVHAPDNIIVRGWGLKSKMGGSLKVLGRFDSTQLDGVLETKEGTFDLLGPEFKIAKGTVTFKDGNGLMPNIDFLGTHTLKEKSILVKGIATGPADRFKVKFQSEPELGQNEILSLLILKKSFTQASSFEALKIALLANRIKSRGKENILTYLQNPLGLDVDFEQAPDKASGYKKVKVSKHIYDRLRLEVEQDLETRTTGGKVAYDINPHLSVESGYSSDQQGMVGIKWNKDY